MARAGPNRNLQETLLSSSSTPPCTDRVIDLANYLTIPLECHATLPILVRFYRHFISAYPYGLWLNTVPYGKEMYAIDLCRVRVYPPRVTVRVT